MPTTASASEVYEAMKAQRNELQRQLGQLEEKRRAIASRLREGEVSGADKTGLEARLTDLDAQITEMYKTLGVANDQVARAAAQPGAVVPDFPQRVGPPEEVIVMGFVLAMTMILPISIAIARRIWRRGSAPATAPISREMDERMSRLEQAMDAVAVEVERVGEGQRYMTRVLGSGAAEPLAVRAREGIEVPR
ncbi:MAG: hypothetical protein IT359_09155 [Gemmatimonadaceae bacterium]|nr:hypothetical protein [Gemmatimonadaceae bacterium]